MLRTPSLYCAVLGAICLSVAVTLAVVAVTFGLLLPAQARALADAYRRSGPPGTPAPVEPWMWVAAAVLCVAETAAFLAASVVVAVPLLLDSLFDRVLLFKGVKHVQPDGENDSVRTVGLRFRNPVVGTRMLCRRWRKVFLFQGVQLLSLAATLPVNLLPGIGTAVWIGANGLLLGTRNWPMRPSWWLRTNFDLLSSQLFRVPSAKRPLSHLDAAWDSHLHYLMDYRGMSLRQTKDHVWKNKLEYGAFGATAFTLSVIPLANMVFAVCNTVGAALWAVEIEKQRGNPCFLESRGAASSAGSDAVAALDIAVEPFGAGAQREFGNGTGSAAAVPASTSPGAGAPDETSGPSRSTSTSWLLGTMKAAVR